MAPSVFSSLLLVASAAIAYWLVAKVPALAPRRLRSVSLSLGLALASLLGATSAFSGVRGITGGPAAVVLVGLPTGVLVVLSATGLLSCVVRSTRTNSR